MEKTLLEKKDYNFVKNMLLLTILNQEHAEKSIKDAHTHIHYVTPICIKCSIIFIAQLKFKTKQLNSSCFAIFIRSNHPYIIKISDNRVIL